MSFTPRPLLMLTLAVLSMAWVADSDASRMYRWKDAQGVTHYGDRPPEGAAKQQAPSSAVSVIPFRNTPSAMVRLRVEPQGPNYQAWADNTVHGPMQVELRFRRHRGVTTNPQLPIRATLAARATARLALIQPDDPFAGGEYELEMDVVPGDPNARHNASYQYRVPFEYARVRVDQGPGGSYSHNDPQNYHAIDFALPVGTPVLAAREGVVMQVESDFEKASLNREKAAGRANFIRILHNDGSMAVYAHLQWEGVQVRVGQRIDKGQRIGLSGNTGFSTGPHLHFVVQANRGMQLASVPIRLFGPLGELKFASVR